MAIYIYIYITCQGKAEKRERDKTEGIFFISWFMIETWLEHDKILPSNGDHLQLTSEIRDLPVIKFHSRFIFWGISLLFSCCIQMGRLDFFLFITMRMKFENDWWLSDKTHSCRPVVGDLSVFVKWKKSISLFWC